jgi:hypothetical protein
MEKLKKMKGDAIVIGGVAFGASFLRSKIEEHQPHIVYVDGLYLMYDEEGAQQHWLQMMNISRELKTIGDDYKLPVIATTQMDNSQKRGSKGDEHVSDIMYAQALSQNADNIVSLGRIWDDVMEDFTNRLWVKLVKLREGEPVKFQVEFDFNKMEMIECSDVAGFSIEKNKEKEEGADPKKDWRSREKDRVKASKGKGESPINEDDILF